MGGGKRRTIWEAQSLRSFPFQIVFASIEGLRRYDFIIVGGVQIRAGQKYPATLHDGYFE